MQNAKQNFFQKNKTNLIIKNSLKFNRKKIENPLTKILKNHIIFYPTPKNINYG